MSDAAIRVDGLSKRYRLGQREPYVALRDVLARQVWAPLQALSRLAKGSSPKSGQENRGQSNWIWALRDISFEVKEGEVLGVIGRNGAGKSTLLKILSRITKPTAGRAEIRGRVGSLLEVGTGFHPELTGRENVYLNGAILGMKRVEIRRRFDEIVAFAEIEQFLDTPVKRYSSGMHMRLAFAVAAHLEPEILIVDEVLAVGDAAFQRKCLGKMGNVARDGRTILFVSHNMAAVEQLCTRAMLLAGGSTLISGGVQHVIKSYIGSLTRQDEVPGTVLASSQDESTELLAVHLIDKTGQTNSAAMSGQDLILELTLRTTRDLPKIEVAVGINSMHEVRLAILQTRVIGYTQSLAPGTYAVRCKVHRLPFAAGTYALDVKVISENEVVIWAPHVEQLMVETGDFYDTGILPDPKWAGLCHLEQQWEIHRDGSV